VATDSGVVHQVFDGRRCSSTDGLMPLATSDKQWLPQYALIQMDLVM
jgi:hypothetical protein